MQRHGPSTEALLQRRAELRELELDQDSALLAEWVTVITALDRQLRKEHEGPKRGFDDHALKEGFRRWVGMLVELGAASSAVAVVISSDSDFADCVREAMADGVAVVVVCDRRNAKQSYLAEVRGAVVGDWPMIANASVTQFGRRRRQLQPCKWELGGFAAQGCDLHNAGRDCPFIHRDQPGWRSEWAGQPAALCRPALLTPSPSPPPAPASVARRSAPRPSSPAAPRRVAVAAAGSNSSKARQGTNRWQSCGALPAGHVPARVLARSSAERVARDLARYITGQPGQAISAVNMAPFYAQHPEHRGLTKAKALCVEYPALLTWVDGAHAGLHQIVVTPVAPAPGRRPALKTNMYSLLAIEGDSDSDSAECSESTGSGTDSDPDHAATTG